MSRMEVVKARHAGACYGVQRALELAADTARSGNRVTTLGPLIHNPQVVSALECQGIHAQDDPAAITEGIVVIRSHGVTPLVQESLEHRGLSIVDATCPHVKKAQNSAMQLAKSHGYVLVVGAAGHPEVEGLRAYVQVVGADVAVVGGPADLPADLPPRVGVVVQTTQQHAVLAQVVQALEQRGIEAEVKNTICFATSHRQDAAAELASEVDAMVVIGGRNSANTTHLAQICQKVCANTHHIETSDELNPAWFTGCTRVGVTAGASTPEEYIEAVIKALRGF